MTSRLALSSPDPANPMWLGDLDATLTYSVAAEDERVSVLLNRPGAGSASPFGSGLSSVDITLDDAAATNVFSINTATGSCRLDGRLGVSPYSPLPPAFNANDSTAGLAALHGGMLASQQWHLLIADTAGYGSAQLDSWRLALSGTSAGFTDRVEAHSGAVELSADGGGALASASGIWVP